MTPDSLGQVMTSRNGSHHVEATATDAAGNVGTAAIDFLLDTQAPSVASVQHVRSKRGVTELVVTFNERLNAATVGRLENYKISLPGRRPKSVALASVWFDGDRTVTLRLQKPARTNGTLDVAFSGSTIADLAGNRLS